MPTLKLAVEVRYALLYALLNEEGSASTYTVQVEFYLQRLRTKQRPQSVTIQWNETLEFNVHDIESLECECLDVRLYSSSPHNPYFSLAGRAKVEPIHFKHRGADQITESPYPLKKGLSFISLKKGVIYLKVYYWDEEKPVKPLGGHGGASGATLAVGGRGENVGKHAAGKHVADADGRNISTSTASSEDFSVKPAKIPKTEHIQHKLVDNMLYLFVRVERARFFANRDTWADNWDLVVKVKVGNVKQSRPGFWRPSDQEAEWNEVFAFSEEQYRSQKVDITVNRKGPIGEKVRGRISFDAKEVPQRLFPDSPIAPQWYEFESRDNDKRLLMGKIMLSVWIGTQADETFPRAHQSDSRWGTNIRTQQLGSEWETTRAAVYHSPRLWYLRVGVREAKDLVVTKSDRIPEVYVQVRLGNQQYKQTRTISPWNFGNPSWPEEELVVIAPEPFLDEALSVGVVDCTKDETIASVRIPLNDVPRSAKKRPVEPKWYDLTPENKELKDKVHELIDEKLKGHEKYHVSRIYLFLCLEGGYHVLDELTQYTSDTLPSDRKLWPKSAMAILELGIRKAEGLQPMKVRDGKNRTDAYCVAKYGQKWVRTRTVLDSLEPQWHEQYMWNVYDPCTVLTLGVFDNQRLAFNGQKNGKKANGTMKHGGSAKPKDMIIGKVRIRLSTLDTGREYALRYPLIVLERSGVKRRGEIELVARLSCVKRYDMMEAYIRPLLPKPHYTRPITNMRSTYQLRQDAMRIVKARFEQSEPPLWPEVVHHMLDIDQQRWSIRRTRVHWHRIGKAFQRFTALGPWFHNIYMWKNPISTVCVIVLYLILVWSPELILPILFLYMFFIGVWKYRFRARKPSHMDVTRSLVDPTTQEELAEEFDSNPSVATPDQIRSRYDTLRRWGEQVMEWMGNFAMQLERFHALFDWSDRRATTIFLTFCLVAAILLYVVPFQLLATVAGLYILRPPRLPWLQRKSTPSWPMNFFKRLPTLSDSLL